MIVQTKITAPVGAAIGRPSVGICSDVKQHASAVKISAMSPVGLTRKRRFPFSMRIGRAPNTRTSDARPYGCGIVVKSASAKKLFHCYRSGTGNNDYLKCSNDREKNASAKKNITIVTGRDTGNKNY